VLASLAPVKNLVPPAVVSERLRQRRFARRRPDVASETAEERPVPRADAFQHERPGVRRFVSQGVLAFGRREMRGDGDPMRPPVNDFSAGQLAIRETHLGRTEMESRRQAVIEKLKKVSLARRLVGEERAHAIRLTGAEERTMTKRIAWGLAALLVAAGSAAAPAGKSVTYPSGSETVSGYLALPEGTGKKPALVVIQEWWGLNDFVKAKADDFAKKGYVALAVDLYRGKVATDPDTAHQLMRGMPEDRAMRDLKAGFDYLRSRDDVDAGRIGSIGWCMGGGYSLQLALAQPKLAGTVIYYGRLVTDDAAIKGLSVPLLGNFGGQDKGIPPDSIREFERKAKAAGKSVDFKIYPDAGHGFASSKDPAVFRADDAKDADARTDAFFEKVLKKK
jgi:carboxymethylenebutenolidase